jgi:hypothetical protein
VRPLGPLLGDLVLALWIALWVTVGVLVGIDVQRLLALARTVAIAGRALGQTAQVLHGISSLPLVGHDLAPLAERLSATAVAARASARSARSSVIQLSYLLAVAVAVIPSTAALVVRRPRLRRRAGTQATPLPPSGDATSESEQ